MRRRQLIMLKYLFYGLYIVSFFLPSYVSGKMYADGYGCFISAIDLMTEGSLIGFYGFLPNVMVLIVVPMKWLMNASWKRALLTLVTISSVLSWTISPEFKDGLDYGYWLWGVSSMVIVALAIRLNRSSFSKELNN